MKTSLIMCTLKILTDLCAIKQKIKIKYNFENVVYNVLAVVAQLALKIISNNYLFLLKFMLILNVF